VSRFLQLGALAAILSLCGCPKVPPGVHYVAISWTVPDATGVTGYTVYRGTAPGQTSAAVTSTSTTSYVDLTVQGGSTYYYTVTSKNATAQSTKSNEIVAIVPK
jgi:fibronectin type 3 domain-containing protein